MPETAGLARFLALGGVTPTRNEILRQRVHTSRLLQATRGNTMEIEV